MYWSCWRWLCRWRLLYQRWDDRLNLEEGHPDDGPVRFGVAEVAIVGMCWVGTGAYEFLRSYETGVGFAEHTHEALNAASTSAGTLIVS